MLVSRIYNGCLDTVKNIGSELSWSKIETPILFLITDGLIEYADLDFCESNPYIVFCI